MEMSVIILMALIIMLSILGMMGYIVYKDAKAIGLNAILWVVVVIFVPNFMGIIIYLVVRALSPKNATCSVCKAQIKENYNICPECNSRFSAWCEKCNNPVDVNLTRCPYCGGSAEKLQPPNAIKIFQKTNIAKFIGMVVALFAGAIIVLVVIAFGLGKVLHNVEYAPNNLAIINMENNIGNTYKNSFYYKNGDSRANFKVDSNTQGILKGQVTVKEGQILLKITDSTNNIIYENAFTSNEVPYMINLELQDEEENYTAYITYQKARGDIELVAK